MPNHTSGHIGFGSRIGYSANGDAYNDLAQIVDISGPNVDVSEIRLGHNDLPEPWIEMLPGITDPGTVTFNCIHKKGLVMSLTSLLPSAANWRPIYWWRISYPDGSFWVCQGFLKRLARSTPLEDADTVDVTIRFSGKATHHLGLS